MPVTAHILEPEEKASIWPRLVEQHEGRRRYETLTERDLKVVAFVPATDGV